MENIENMDATSMALHTSNLDDINPPCNVSTPIVPIGTASTSNSDTSTDTLNNASTSNIHANASSSSHINNTPNATATTNGKEKKKRSHDFQNRKIRRRIWQEDEVHKLILVWGGRLGDLRQSKKNRHIYEEISLELNRMGLDTIREEVHIKIQNLSQLYR